MRYAALMVIFLFPDLQVTAQKDDPGSYFSAGLQTQYGFIIPHSEKISEVAGANPAGLEINLNRLHTSYDSWKIFNSYWISGFQVCYFNFANYRVLGSAFTTTVYAEPVIVRGRKYLLSVRGGAGFSYHTHIYDTIENPANKFFSTRIGFPLYISPRFSYRVTGKTLLTISGYYNHISNGGIKQPNTGMNFPTISAGVQYFPGGFPDLHHEFRSDVKIIPGISLLVQALSGYRVVDRTEAYPEKGTFAYGLHVRASKQLKTFYALNAGAEVISDGAIREMIRRQGLSTDHRRAAVTAGQSFIFGKAVFTQYFGFYIYSPYKARNKVYEKYELAWKISPDFFAGVYIKAHAQVAELMGLNLSYFLYRKQKD